MVIFHRFFYVYQRVTVGAHLVPTNHISFNFNPFQAQCDPSLAAAKPELVMVSCLTAYMHGARSTRAFVQLAMDLKGLRHPPPSFEEPLKCTCSKWCNKPKGNLQHHSNNVQDFECCLFLQSRNNIQNTSSKITTYQISKTGHLYLHRRRSANLQGSTGLNSFHKLLHLSRECSLRLIKLCLFLLKCLRKMKGVT
jgi:hypothetical protein